MDLDMDKEVRNLEKAMRENDEMDGRLVMQEERMGEIKTRQQELMDTMTNRISRLYSRWQLIQDRQKDKLEESFNLAHQQLPAGGRKMLTPEEVKVMKLKLEVVEDKMALLTTLDTTAQSMHNRVGHNGHKLEEVATKAREVEARLKKLVSSLTQGSTTVQEDAKNILLKEIARLEKMEGEKKEKAFQLAVDLKQFIEKVTDANEKAKLPKSTSSSGEDNPSETLKNGEIVATEPQQNAVATDSLTQASDDQKQ